MADLKITQLNELFIADPADVLPIVDTSLPETKKIQFGNLMGSPGPIGDTTPSTGDFTSLSLPIGATINEFSTDVNLAGDSNTAVPTEHAVKTYVDNAISGLTTQHNSLLGLQGGDATTSEFYHLTKAIYDGLFSASPIIGIGSETGTNIKVDYGLNIITADITGSPQITINSSGLALASGTTINEFSTDGALIGDSDIAVPTEKAVKTYVDNAISGLTTQHNNLLGLQGGDATADEFYHLTEAVYNGLFSASPIIGIGSEAETNIKVDYGTDLITMDVGAVEVFNATALIQKFGSESYILIDQTSNSVIISENSINAFVISENGISVENGATINEFSTDGTLSGNSDTAIPTEKAVKTYVDNQTPFTGLDENGVVFVDSDGHLAVNAPYFWWDATTSYVAYPLGVLNVEGGIVGKEGIAAGTIVDQPGYDPSIFVSPFAAGWYPYYTGDSTFASAALFAGTYLPTASGKSVAGALVNATLIGSVESSQGTINGLQVTSWGTGGVSVSSIYGIFASNQLDSGCSAINNYNFYSSHILGGATLTNHYSIYIENGVGGAPASLTNEYGIYIEDLVWGTNKYAIYVAGETSKVQLEGSLQFNVGASINEFSTDGTLSGDSDNAVPTEKAVKTYVDQAVVPFTELDAYGVVFVDSTGGLAVEPSHFYWDPSTDTLTVESSIISRDIFVAGTVDSAPSPPGIKSPFGSGWYLYSGTETTIMGGAFVNVSIPQSVDTVMFGLSAQSIMLGTAETDQAVNTGIEAKAQASAGVNIDTRQIGVAVETIIDSGTTVANNYGVRISTTVEGSLTDGYGLFVDGIDGPATIFTNWYGVYIAEVDIADNNYSLYTTGASSLVHFSGYLELGIGATINEFSTDITLSGNSDEAIPTEKAIKTYVDGKFISGSGFTISYISSDSTASTGDALLIDSTASPVNITLVPSVDAAIAIKKITSDGNNITVTAQGGGLIDGNPQLTFSVLNQAYYFLCDGINFYII